MWKDSDKCQMFMLLWLIAAGVATGGWFPFVANLFAAFYGIAGMYYIWKDK